MLQDVNVTLLMVPGKGEALCIYMLIYIHPVVSLEDYIFFSGEGGDL